MNSYSLTSSAKRFIPFIFSALCGLTSTAIAVPAAPHTYALDVNGQTMTVRNKGNEWLNWIETDKGYAIAPDANGEYFYISHFNGNKPVLSTTSATLVPPSTIKAHIAPTTAGSMPAVRSAPSLTTTSRANTNGSFNGSIVFILVNFNNQSYTTTANSWGSFIKNNIRDYYLKASHRKVRFTPAVETSGNANDGVVGWIKLNRNHPNYGGNIGSSARTLTAQAITAADPYIDYAAYDQNGDGYVDSDELSVVVIVAGQEAAIYGATGNKIWAHAWALNTPVTADGVKIGTYHRGQLGYAQFGEMQGDHQATMGVMVHELGHLTFGLPDLYDTDDSSDGAGSYCVMSGGSWGAAYGDSAWGQTPVMPSAWIKKYKGWASPVLGSGVTSLTASGSTAATAANTVRRARTSASNEYFLVENRQPLGYDRGLEYLIGTNNFGGLAIWHIDDKMTSNGNDAHRWVDLEKADNNEGEGASDFWYLGNKTAFNNTSKPNSKNYAGAATGVDINSISTSAEVMTADFQ